jgi:TRAP-type C4-dicarboxylate transport system substrate-binding protein
MGNFAMGAVTLLVPELQMLMLPFYFESAAEQDCVLDKHLSGAIDGLLAAKGLKLLGYGEVGVIDLASKKSLLDVASARGLKATAYSKTQGMFWSSIGVNATFIGTPEWASALQTGLIDFTTSPVALYVPAGINKAAPVYNRLNLWYTPALTLMNRGRYDSLGAAQKAALHKAYDIEAAPKLRAEIRGLEDKLRQAHVAGGGQLLEPSPAQRAGWRDAAAKVWPQMVEVVGGQAGNFFKTIEAARGSCKG